MSRSYNERSIPQGRGRRGEMKAKRLSHRRARQNEDIYTLKYSTLNVLLDRETKQKDVGC